MAKVKTVKIVNSDSKSGYCLINLSDFDHGAHTLYKESVAPAEEVSPTEVSASVEPPVDGPPVSRKDMMAYLRRKDVPFKGNISNAKLTALYGEHQ